MQDNCGVFGIFSNKDIAEDIYMGIDFLQHRGQEYCGIATLKNNNINLITHKGRVNDRFSETDIKNLKGNIGIGHVSLHDRQPIKLESKLGIFSSCFSGNIINDKELFSELKARGHSFSITSHIELISKIIGEGDTLIEGIKLLSDKAIGAFALLLLTKEGIIAVRDPFGFKPLIIGKGNNELIVASESRAIECLNKKIIRDVKPGEIIMLNNKGVKTLYKIPSSRTARCAFEWAYIASIDSKIDGIYVKKVRNNLGEKLAERDLKEEGIKADCVAPVPMSGIGHALGYHKKSKIQYQEIFLYNRYADRSYTKPTQIARDKMANKKLSVIREAVEGKKIILCDDSIIRGTQISNKVKELKSAGAKEIHVRVACPPIMHPCKFGISTRNYNELAARYFLKEKEIDSLEKQKILEKKIAKKINATSVKYNTLENLIEAIGLPREKLCLTCWNGLMIKNKKTKEQIQLTMKG